MNLLIDECPEFVIIDNEEYEIDSNFRASILFELAMQDSKLSTEQRIKVALELYYPVIPGDIKEAIEAILWFYSCGETGETSIEVGQEEKEEPTRKEGAVYSFKYDDEYIYAAFLTQYNIDLNAIEYLHWWKFKALFKSLNSNNKLIEIMNIRSTKIIKDMSKERKKELRELKELYRLPDNRTEAEKQAGFSEDLDSLF